MVEERADELEYLRWFAWNADFGPADFDVQIILQDTFEEREGKLVPFGWRIRDTEEES